MMIKEMGDMPNIKESLDLALCPFCLGEASMECVSDAPAFSAVCSDCDAIGPDGGTQEQAAAEWNERIDDVKDDDMELLRELCAAAYQVVGAADGPVEMLDNLSAAANGEALPHKPHAGIPWVPEDE